MPKGGLLKARYDAAEATTDALPDALALILACRRLTGWSAPPP
jgi:hypothetical protein